MSRFWQRTGAVLLIAGVLFASNLHLPVIQVVAWARMYSHYREGYAPAAALAITFSGKAPCNLCKFVSAAQQESRKFDGMMTWLTRDLLPLMIAGILLAAPQVSGRLRVPPCKAVQDWIVPPATPPPKSVWHILAVTAS